MKVTYVFDIGWEEENNDRYDLKIFQLSSQMYSALSDISDYMRELRKGWCKDNVEQIEEKISDIILGSNIGDIE